MKTTMLNYPSDPIAANKARCTLEEVADDLGLTLDQVRNQIKRGHLRAIKVTARKWGYVLREDLDAFMQRINGGAK